MKISVLVYEWGSPSLIFTEDDKENECRNILMSSIPENNYSDP
jgi:hypothetical protein